MDEDLEKSKTVEALIEDIASLGGSGSVNFHAGNLITAIKKFGCVFIKLTNRVECLTRWLMVLTVVLCIIGAAQIAFAIFQICSRN